ncbi:MAG: 1-acyl-sn-glycerol-3-phosphate acyltransferase [Betaproteobacteria bacterium]
MPRAVVAVAPHSSIWDFNIGASLMLVLGLRVSFVAKQSLFWWPLGNLLRWLVGIPVNRAQPEGITETLAAEYQRQERLWLAITPEGIRSAGARFKSGVHRVAEAAGVPILPVRFNYRRRALGFFSPHQPHADAAAGVDAVRRMLLF